MTIRGAQTDDDSRRQQVAVGDVHHRVLPAVAKLDADADAARTVGSDRSRLDDRGARDAEPTVGRGVETAVEIPRTAARPRVMPTEGTEAAEARIVDRPGRPKVVDQRREPAARFEPADVPGADHPSTVRTPEQPRPDDPVACLV